MDNNDDDLFKTIMECEKLTLQIHRKKNNINKKETEDYCRLTADVPNLQDVT